jgi:exodeoxyribonuclease VII small subunit
MSAKKAAASKPQEARYADAMAELEQILEDLEGDSIDVDELSSRVKRASELIKLCRERLTRSRAEIEQVVADLEAFEQEAEAEPD